jgi:predicted GNAT superfamily acetyltransferase
VATDAPDQHDTRQADALVAFAPERFGFRRDRAGWVRELAGLGAVAVVPLSWQHAHAASYDDTGGERLITDALNLIVGLQRRTWGMPGEELVPSNLLAITADTGGSVLIAYDLARGCNVDGWLGFAIALGGRSGTLVSHMLGVREEARGAWDIGWYLKVIQGYEALRAGHATAIWTFDPMRGANARLNLEKLGAEVHEFTIDKYGALRSELYGDVPSDRLTARWNLLTSATARRLDQVFGGRYGGHTLAAVTHLPEATAHTLADLVHARPHHLRYRIPGDIDRLMRDDPRAAIAWRQEMRDVLTTFLTTKAARLDEGGRDGPIAVGTTTRPGLYRITGFATGWDEHGERVSYYLLERGDATIEEAR